MSKSKVKAWDYFIDKAIRILGAEHVLYEREDIFPYGFDASRLGNIPLCVVFPKSSEEVSALLQEATRYEMPIYPRGAGSNMVGGVVPAKTGIVISFERMANIINIDADNFTCLVEPGVVTGILQKAVSSYGLFYPPDPSSLSFSTIGGNVATCAGGPRAVKYGVTRDYVMSLEVVLASGKIIKTGGSTIKRVVGYDLTRLMVGSEGTLGIFTKILLRLIPAPGNRYLLLVLFRSVEDASRTVVAVLKHRIVPSAIEFIDEAVLKIIADSSPFPIDPAGKSLLFIELDDPEGIIEKNTDLVRQICLDQKAISVRVSRSEAENEKMWSLRRAVSPSLAKIRRGKINEDVAVPINQLPSLVAGIKALSESLDIPIASFGHAGDGNLHVNILYDPTDSEEKERAKKATEALFKHVLELGGTISGEHGIGIAKSPFIRWEVTPDTLETMWLLKKTLDPCNILNPGKIFVPNRAFIER